MKCPLLSFLGGALVGAAIALLYAPETGNETRRKLHGMVAQGKQKMKDAVEEGYDKINEYKMTD